MHKASIEKSFPVFKEQPWNLKFAHQTGRNGITWEIFQTNIT
jgi:hypothetical protein